MPTAVSWCGVLSAFTVAWGRRPSQENATVPKKGARVAVLIHPETQLVEGYRRNTGVKGVDARQGRGSLVPKLPGFVLDIHFPI